MRTLIVDTSGAFTTVAVAEGKVLAGYSALRIQPLTHLHDQVRALLAKLELAMADVERVAVVTGPGSWTGLNIGVTAAKTLAQVLAVPTVELNTLDALVAARRWAAGPVCALLDAKRSNAYFSLYPTDGQGVVQLAQGRARMVAFPELCDLLREQEETPLVVEYGRVFHDRIADGLDGVCVTCTELLGPEGLLRALSSAGPDLHGDDAFAVSPLYLQKVRIGGEGQEKTRQEIKGC